MRSVDASSASERVPAPAVPDQLREMMERGDVVPFVGAGVSMGAELPNGLRMPSYPELLRRLVARAEREDRFPSAKDRDHCLQMIQQGKLLEAADTFDKILNKPTLYSLLRSELNHLQPKPSLVHELLNLLNFPIILTSNYDRLLETTLYPTPEVLTYRDTISIPLLMRERRPFVFKIHGDLTRPETIVLGWSQYKRLHHKEEKGGNEALHSFIHTLLATKSLLFLGCSFAASEYSEYFSDFADTYKIESGPHWALVGPSTLSRSDKDFWYHKLGVTILEYEPDRDHSQVWEFLAALKPQRVSAPPRRGQSWETFYVLEERPDYLKLQLNQEQDASSCCYITPSLTNGLATESYIRTSCEQELKRFTDYVSDFEQFRKATIDLMLQRAANIQRVIEGGLSEIRAIFLADSLDEELRVNGAVEVERLRHVLSLAERFPQSLRLRAYAGQMTRKDFMKSTYALVFGNGAPLDIACFYAPQATTNKFKAHIVQINTRPVTERVEYFERMWVSSHREKETLDLIRQKLQ